MKGIWGRIGAMSPLDRTAAAVTSESRDTPQERPYSRQHWKAPPAFVPPSPIVRASSDFEDMTGRTFGKFTVLGILHSREPRRGAPQLWVCRCACGDYETRRARAIRNPANSRDACEDCQRLDWIRHREQAKASGLVPRVTVEEVVERIKANAKGGLP